MGRAPRRITIPVEEGIVDKEYIGYRTSDEPSNCYHMCSLIYKGNGTAWCFGNEKDVIKNIQFLDRYTTFEEDTAWYKKQFNINDARTQNNLFGLYHDMYDVGDAVHEIWNAWVEAEWYEMSDNLNDEGFLLLGIAPAPFDWTLGSDCVAVICEAENGERFWCHAGKHWIEDMRKEMQEVYNELNSNS